MSALSNDSIESNSIDFGGRFARQFFHNNWPNIEPDLATAVQLQALNAGNQTDNNNNNNNNIISNNNNNNNNNATSSTPVAALNNTTNHSKQSNQSQTCTTNMPSPNAASTTTAAIGNSEVSFCDSGYDSFEHTSTSTANLHATPTSATSTLAIGPTSTSATQSTTTTSLPSKQAIVTKPKLTPSQLIMTSDIVVRQQRSNSLFTTMTAVANTLTTNTTTYNTINNNNYNCRNLNSISPASTLAASASLASTPLNPWSSQDNFNQRFNDVDKIERAASLHRTAASYSEPQYTWSGQLPSRSYKNPTFSCKVFLGGVPWDVTEQGLLETFGRFGPLRIQWPGKDARQQTGHTKAGYVYLIYESERYVKALLQACTQDFGSGSHPEKYYYQLSSRRMRFKEVQVIPWFQADSNYVRNNSGRPDMHRTVFVGALHGMLTAEGLAKIMNDLFGGVSYVGIDTDKFKYPLGSGRVSFNNQRSYMKAVSAAFIEIKSSQFCKKIQVDPYLEPRNCSTCHIQSGIVFCRDCLRYFCKTCWNWHHSAESIVGRQHRPLMRKKRET